MAKAKLKVQEPPADIADVADMISPLAAGDGAQTEAPELPPVSGSTDTETEKRKPGRPVGSGKKVRRVDNSAAIAEKREADRLAAIAAEEQSYGQLFSILLTVGGRILDKKFGEGTGWTPQEIQEATPLAGRVLRKYMGESAYSDEIALAAMVVMPPLLRIAASLDKTEK